MKADLFLGLAEQNKNPVCQKGEYSTVRLNADAVGGGERLADCALCIEDSPVYDFGLVCCRVRFILSVPVLEVRRAWLERWKRQDGEMCAVVEREVAAKWKLNRGRDADGED